MKTVRITAKTIDAAVAEGLKQLGISREEAVVHVVEQPQSGLFGLIHKKDAVVEISAPDLEEPEEKQEEPKAAEPVEAPAAEPEEKEEAATVEEAPKAEETPAEVAPEEAPKKEKKAKEDFVFKPEEQEETANEAKAFLENVFKGMHLDVTMERMMNQDRILFNLEGEGLGILIGKHGQTLDALQYLTNLAAGKKYHHHYFVLLDVENYRERRKDTLEGLAHRLAGRAKRSGEPMKLEPMPAGERRIIHMALADDKAVTTESEGEAPYRYVVIKPNR